MGYLFDPHLLHEIARKHLDKPKEQMVQGIADELASRYPGHIQKKQRWLFNLSGGYVGVMTILHASLSEYILFFGTPIGAHGFSGRYWMDVYDYMMAGELSDFSDSSFWEPSVTRPGEFAHLKRGKAKGFKLTPGSWMLEYGRGIIPASLPFALAYAFFTCFDLRTIFKTLWIYTKMVVKELWKGKI